MSDVANKKLCLGDYITPEMTIEERKEILGLQLMNGGKTPPTTGADWLSDLPEGTLFYAQSKTNPMDFNLGLFKVAEKDEKVVVLISPQVSTILPVNPVRFCNQYTLFQNKGIEKKEEENSHDAGNRNEGDGGTEGKGLE